MCYQTAAQKTETELQKRLGARDIKRASQGLLPLAMTLAFVRPWWPVVTAEEPDVLQYRQWGYVPPHAQDDPVTFLKKYSTYNAKSETIGTSSTFKSAVKEGRRCLIPITAFREFQHRNAGKLKVPFDIKHKGEDVMCLLGLYNDASYTILTTGANALMSEIHNSKLRQPCIVDRAFERDWLSPNLNDEDVKRFCEASRQVELIAETDYQEQQQSLF